MLRCAFPEMVSDGDRPLGRYLAKRRRLLHLHCGDVVPRSAELAEHKGVEIAAVLRQAALAEQELPQFGADGGIAPHPQRVSVHILLCRWGRYIRNKIQKRFSTCLYQLCRSRQYLSVRFRTGLWLDHWLCFDLNHSTAVFFIYFLFLSFIFVQDFFPNNHGPVK